MKDEEIMIHLEKNHYDVEATFHFSNQGETKELSVGFPKFGKGYYPEFQGTKDFLSFETWVNKEPVTFEEYLDSSSLKIDVSGLNFKEFCEAMAKKELKDGSIEITENSWMAKKVKFVSNQITETKIKYSSPYRELADSRIAYYIFGTGSTWSGNIGNATFKIISSKDIPELIVRFNDQKRYNNSLIKKDSEQEYTVEIQNFKPEFSDRIEVLKDFPKY